jgi:hypothetical protein
MSLRETQALFWDVLAGADPRGPRAAEVARAFLGTAALPAAERVSIYASMVVYRQIDALREDFPLLARLCGDAAFGALARAYLAAHPSAHPSLARLGRALPGFLRGAQARAELGDLWRPDLPELAALEWARSEVFEEADRAPQGVLALAQLGAAGFATARVQLVPALRTLAFAHDVAALYAALDVLSDQHGEHAGHEASAQQPSHDANGAHQHASVAAPPAAQPLAAQRATQVVVWRNELRVFHAALARDEAEALRLASQGAPLGEVCGAFSARPEPAQAAFTALRSWFADGWIATVA